MGVKAFKEHYGITHTVQMMKKHRMPERVLCIGSAYVHDLITVAMDGTIVDRSSVGQSSETLNGYVRKIEADPEKAKQLIEQEDTFEKLVTIWTYDGSEIIEKQCEVPEWPHTTTDGEMIFDNTHSTNRDEVVAFAKRNAIAARELLRDTRDGCQERLDRAIQRLREAERDCERLGV